MLFRKTESAGYGQDKVDSGTSHTPECETTQTFPWIDELLQAVHPKIQYTSFPIP